MRTPTRQGILLSIALLAPLGGAAAQAVPPLGSGARLRVSHDCYRRTLSTGRVRLQCKTAEGSFNGIDRGSVLLTRKSGDPLAVPVASIDRLEVREPVVPGQVSQSRVGKQIASQAITGSLVTFGGSIAFAYIGAAMTSGCCGDDPGLVGAVLGLLAGAALLPAVPVYMVGRGGPAQGTFGATLAGSLVGSGAFLLALSALDLDADNLSFWIGFYGLPVTGAIAGYHASARRTEGWIAVPLEQARLTVSPTLARGPGLRARLEF